MARRARHRSPRQRSGGRREPFAWLGAGAVTLGVGAALAAGPAVARADDTSSSSATSSSATSTTSTTSATSGATETSRPAAVHVWHLPTLSMPRKPHHSAHAGSPSAGAATTPKTSAGSTAAADTPSAPSVRHGEAAAEHDALTPARPVPAAAPAEVAAVRVNSVTPHVVPGLTQTFRAVVRALTAPWTVSGSGRGTPAESPAVWVLAATARRQIGATEDTAVTPAAATATVSALAVATANADPVFGTATVGTPNSSTGVVTGKVVATDADKDTLTYTAAAQSTAGGTVALNTSTGTFTYTPTTAARHAAAAIGATTATSDTFTVDASDGNGGTATQTVTVKVAPLNTAPVLAATQVAGAVSATDPDGDTLSYSATPTKGTIAFSSTGAFTYTPTAAAQHAAAATGASSSVKTDTFTVTVSDGYGGTVAAKVTVTITPADTAPVISTIPTVSAPNAATGVVTGTVAATDADNDKLTYAATAAKGTVSINTGTGVFTYTPTTAARHAAASDTATDADKSDTVTITVSDGHGGTVTSAVDVTVAPRDSAPKVSATVGSPNSMTGVVTGTIKATDAEKDTVVYSVTTATAKGTLTLDASSGAYTYTPTTDARLAAAAKGAGTAATHDTFTVAVDDGHGATVTKTVTVSVSPLGDKPVAGTPSVGSADSTGTVTGTVEFTEPYPQLPLTYAVTTATTKGTITLDAVTGEFTYTPNTVARLAAGVSTTPVTDKFTVSAANSITSTAETVTVTVAPAVLGVTDSTGTGGTPFVRTGTLSPDGKTAYVANASAGTVSVTDTASNAVTGTITVGKNPGAIAVSADGATVYVANAGSGTVSVINTATDTVIKTIRVGSTPSGLALRLNGSRLYVANAGSGTVTVINTATRIVTKTIRVGSAPVGLAVSADGSALYVTNTGADSVSVINAATNRLAVTTGLGVAVDTLLSGSGATLSVSNGVDTPVAGTITVGTPSTTTGAVTGSVSYTDPSGKTLTYKVITAPADGTVKVTSTGAFTYTPTVAARLAAALTSGSTDTFTVVATNGLATTAQTVTVPVSGEVNASVALKMVYGTEPVIHISVNGGPSVPVLVDTGSVGLVITSKYVGTQQDLGTSTGSGASGYSGGLSYTFDTYTTTVDFGNGIVSGPTSVDIVSAASQSAFASFAARDGVVGILGIGPNSYGPGPSSVISALPGDLNYGVLIDEQDGLLEFGPNPRSALVTLSGAPWTTLEVQVGTGVVTQVLTVIDSGGVYGTIPSSLVGGGSSVPVGTVIKVYTSDGATLLYSYTTTSGNRPTVTSDTYMNSGTAPFALGPIYISYTGSSAGQTIFDV
ncbi:PecA family PE domain-processing aspartic protease [Mycolicibacterium fluoranthenivorans]|uniref:40-residue YVTN family beta-propeller repeat-containing protein n=1 Tax=Mycolicibacterium fluoranthenivorans TaxID=258505 RepID=A0A1G4W2A6_9MYCO|nr:PecA family PE domain-processing aspartic protease [Mycolicibacterium fluoranthenivorans]SCX15542.1 40-residue YVTN family beta-propeller repeat-containing protein [Mycolicibacterium fluoranthenivorans]